MSNSNYLFEILSKATLQIGGYWCDCPQTLLKINRPRILNENDHDWKNFMKWFLTVDDIEDESYCIASCEPSTGDVSLKKKHVSLQGKVTSIVDDHGLIDHYIYFHLKNIKGFGNKALPSVGDIVQVDAEQARAEGGWKALHVVLAKDEKVWDEDDEEFSIPTTHETRGSMIGLITNVNNSKRCGTVEDTVTFSFCDLVDNYKPCMGDWVQAAVSPGSIARNIRPVRTKQLTGTVTSAPYKGGYSGGINDEIYFELSVCCDDYRPRRGDQVAVRALESKQGRNSWRATEVDFIGRIHPIQENEIANKSNTWVLRGERPQRASKAPALPSFLPQFSIPESLRKCVNSGGDVLSLHPKLLEQVSPENYAARFAALLYLEELAIEAEINSFRLHNVLLTRRGEFLVLNVPGLSVGKPSLIVGDVVKIKPLQDAGGFLGDGLVSLEGYIHYIVMETEELLMKFDNSFHRSFEESDKFDVSFTYSRTPFRRRHLAVKLARERYAKDLLFPSKNPTNCSAPQTKIQLSLASGDAERAKFFNDRLNARQKHAVVRILQGEARPKPYILFGPPGTGKTVTLVEAILQVVTHVPASRLLICAPSNSAVDLLCERLHDSGQVPTDMMVRFNAFRRPPQAIPEKVRPYCHLGETLIVTARYKIVLSTCVTAGQLYSLALPHHHFTHVYVDEAGQATEPECLIPIGIGSKGQIVLTGDPKQLGPVLKSPFANHYGLKVSLLERLMFSEEYLRNNEKYKEDYNPLLVTKLVNNYRSHRSLLTISSELFYDNELEYCAPKELSFSFCNWQHLPTTGFPSIFHGLVGGQLREENSPSFFNAEEIVQVCNYVKLLLKNEAVPCQATDIGVITPYRKQVEKIRLMFKALNVVGVKIGSVEEFQGQERKVIILSTVRSVSPSDIADVSAITALGFLANPKRFNVSITRAIALMIVVGNPFVLAKDEYWRTLLSHHVKNNGYVGCDISPIKTLLQ